MERQPGEIGCGRLVIPAPERHSGRWGRVGLTNWHGAMISLGTLPTGTAAALYATPLARPARAVESPSAETGPRVLLGAGAVIDDTCQHAHGEAYLVGIQPVDGRDTDWMNAAVLQQLASRWVRLELRPLVTACACGTRSEAPDWPSPPVLAGAAGSGRDH
jgi:hypothetical protein